MSIDYKAVVYPCFIQYVGKTFTKFSKCFFSLCINKDFNIRTYMAELSKINLEELKAFLEYIKQYK